MGLKGRMMMGEMINGTVVGEISLRVRVGLVCRGRRSFDCDKEIFHLSVAFSCGIAQKKDRSRLRRWVEASCRGSSCYRTWTIGKLQLRLHLFSFYTSHQRFDEFSSLLDAVNDCPIIRHAMGRRDLTPVRRYEYCPWQDSINAHQPTSSLLRPMSFHSSHFNFSQ
jgi:hypothetical protein